MKRTVIGVVIGSVLGGIIFFPPTIPIFLTLNYGTVGNSKMSETLFWLLPSAGFIVGGVIGGFIAKNRISLASSENKSLSIFFWCMFIFWLLGLELGFGFSPITMIGLGNTSTAIDLWIFPIWTAFAGTILGVIIGLVVLAVYIPIKKFHALNNPVEK